MITCKWRMKRSYILWHIRDMKTCPIQDERIINYIQIHFLNIEYVKFRFDLPL